MGSTTSATRFEGLDTVALLELVRAGDHDAYGELFTRYHDFAYKVARRSNRRHADDLVAEAFRRVLTAISNGAGPTQGFGPYLAATIRSAAAGLAAPYQEVELDVTTLLDDTPGDVDPRVSTAFLSLPEAWQNALWYADVEGMSPRHAAPLLGLPSANAFSALRKRARAGLRSAYLTQVVDAACNEDIRLHLEMLMAGTVTADAVDEAVDRHLRECDECAAIAWRVAAVTGNRLGVALAPALLLFHGFATGTTLLPAGIGLTGVVGWFRRLPQHAAAAASAATVGGLVVAAVAVGAAVRGNDDDGGVALEPAPTEPVALIDAEPSADGTSGAPADESIARATSPSSSSTPSSSTTSTAPTTTAPTTTAPPSTDGRAATASTSRSSTTSTTAALSTTVPTITPNTTRPTITPTTTSPTITPNTTTPNTTTPTVTPNTTTPNTTSPSTLAPVTTTAPLPTTAPTTVAVVSSTSLPVAPTTAAPTTTAVPTTTVPATTVPTAPPGVARIVDQRTIGVGNQVKKRIVIEVSELTGAPGALTFSVSFAVRSSDNLACGTSGCDLVGVVAPAVATVEIETDAVPVTIAVRDASGSVVQTLTSP